MLQFSKHPPTQEKLLLHRVLWNPNTKYKAMLNEKVVLEAESLVKSNQSSRRSTLQFNQDRFNTLVTPKCPLPPQEVSTSTKPTVSSSRPSKRWSNQMVFITPFKVYKHSHTIPTDQPQKIPTKNCGPNLNYPLLLWYPFTHRSPPARHPPHSHFQLSHLWLCDTQRHSNTMASADNLSSRLQDMLRLNNTNHTIADESSSAKKPLVQVVNQTPTNDDDDDDEPPPIYSKSTTTIRPSDATRRQEGMSLAEQMMRDADRAARQKKKAADSKRQSNAVKVSSLCVWRWSL